MTGVATDRAAMTGLWDAWTEMWNGATGLAGKIVTEDFRIAFGTRIPAADAIRGPRDLAAFVDGFRAGYEALVYRTDIGPAVDGGLVACRWVADFTKAGVERRTGGIDMLRVEDGAGGPRIAEVWSLTGTRSL
ncbi:hypothetical protein [Phytomonospora endophytica]|uniref:SnoaL-like domain-containing protein n=1 Tax=Phytomonospora endophytica TaxID=714109 RepID=A0A841FGN6_9ACTN|nr:hypothetical protein [Phytomonospora endophytica]MBB6035396.1 hypothetical protein [Phytomonospora endophytica]GIG63852.1 hypothetical protein Pen01_01470 [Phytomonospora endophytica]